MHLRHQIVLIFCIALSACADQKDHSLETIRERQYLTASIRKNSPDYFLHQGHPTGFQLELIQLFADYLQVGLYVVPASDSATSFEKIHNQHIDLVASDMSRSSVHPNESVRVISYNLENHDFIWYISYHADSLCTAINFWLDSITQTKTFADLHFKYHIQSQKGHLQSIVFQKNNRISQYDDLIKKHSKGVFWDWRLLASLIYQESHFDPEQVSKAGAIGLMQLMPDVAEKYGITLESSAEEQISAGVKYLFEIDKMLPVEISKIQRVAFILAAYNVGIGHIHDARRLAEKHHKNPNVWFGHVEIELLKKSNRSIVRDSIVRNGYARSYETYNFVRDIFERWGHYRNLIP